MMHRDFVATVANFAVEPPAPATPLPPAVELQQALWRWKSHSLDAAAAVARRDLDAAENAVAERETMRFRIDELVEALRGDATVYRADLATIDEMRQDAAAADARLLDLLASERLQLQKDIDRLGRPSAHVAAYGRPDPGNRHLLDILR